MEIMEKEEKWFALMIRQATKIQKITAGLLRARVPYQDTCNIEDVIATKAHQALRKKLHPDRVNINLDLTEEELHFVEDFVLNYLQ